MPSTETAHKPAIPTPVGVILKDASGLRFMRKLTFKVNVADLDEDVPEIVITAGNLGLKRIDVLAIFPFGEYGSMAHHVEGQGIARVRFTEYPKDVESFEIVALAWGQSS